MTEPDGTLGKEVKYIELGFTGPDKHADKLVQEVQQAIEGFLFDNTKLWLHLRYPDIFFDEEARKFYFVELEPISGNEYLEELRAILERVSGGKVDIAEVEESCINLDNFVRIPLKSGDYGA